MAKERKVQKRNFCLFCGSTGMSKEHIWSDWLSDVLPTTDVHNQNITYSPFHLKADVGAERVTKQGSLLQRKIRKVCVRCNTGWMSTIVDKAKPIAMRLIRGELIDLTESDMRHLASWIAICTIVAEFTEPGTIGISQEEINEVYNTQAPPSYWSICIGRYKGKDWAPYRYHHRGGKVVSGDNIAADIFQNNFAHHKVDGYQITIYTLGSLAIFCSSSTSPIFPNTYTPDKMLKIWIPDNSLNWSSLIRLKDQDMAVLIS